MREVATDTTMVKAVSGLTITGVPPPMRVTFSDPLAFDEDSEFLEPRGGEEIDIPSPHAAKIRIVVVHSSSFSNSWE